MVEIDMSRFLQTFFEESAEHLANMESSLLSLEGSDDKIELLNSIFRGAHTIKGACGMFSFNEILHFTHALENLLDKMREGKIQATRPLIDSLLRATDVLGGLLAAAQSNGPIPDDSAAVQKEIEDALGATGGGKGESQAPTQAKETAAVEYDVKFIPGRNIFLEGMDPMLMLRDLAKLGELTAFSADTTKVPSIEDIDPERCYLSWNARLKTTASVESVKDVFAFVIDSSTVEVVPTASAPTVARAEARTAEKSEKDVRPAAGDQKSAAKPESSSIRVSVEKVDKLINLAGELVIAQSMITQAVKDFTMEKLLALQEAIGEMERNTRELQEQVMAVRMIPIGTVWARFPRVVRDLATSLGKEIELVTSGEETELDKTVIEKIGDPLMHLLRNSVDHGVETAEERTRAGKPEVGTIRLSAFHQGGNVVIDISDDGRGLVTQKIRAKGIERGLIRDGDDLTPEEIHQMIFAPGFSTAEKVTDLSGRGVGMDVVRQNVEALGGSISIETVEGKGTRFRIRLPLTLAVLDALSLSVGDHIFLMPLLSIIESLRPRAEDVKTVCRTGEVMMLRGEALPLVRLHKLFGLEPKCPEICDGVVVVIDNEGQRMGLLVDEVLGQSQVVIKNLEANFRRVDGVMGATILGDGKVALILDVQGLVRIAGKDRVAAASGPGRVEREPVAV